MNSKRLWLPLVHRLFPTLGPGGVPAFFMGKKLGVDATHIVHVTRHMDILEVWERDDDFSVRIYDQKMTETTGPFFLGMNDRDRYRADADVIWRAVRKEDRALAERIAEEETERALAKIRGTGRIDVVKDLADVVPIRFVMRYYGVQVPDPEKLLRLYQTTSKYVFAFWSHPAMRAEAIEAGKELTALLEESVRRRRREGDVHDGDVMGRMLGQPERFVDGDAGIVRSIAGLSSGNLNAPLGLFNYSVDTLMNLDERSRAELTELARSESPSDAARFRAYFDEAERFNVYPPFLYRYAERDTTVAAGTKRERRVPKGATVVNWPSLAAFDPDVYERPYDFVPGRPSWQGINFGHGRHRCLGEHIGQVLLHTMARALFTLPRLRRAPGRAGRIQSLSIQQGKYPYTFTLEFDRITSGRGPSPRLGVRRRRQRAEHAIPEA